LSGVPTFDELISDCEHSAVHLEMRDDYGPTDPGFADWKAGKPVDVVHLFRDWQETVQATTRRGVVMRRARIVSEPLSDYIRYEYESTAKLNIAAGEQVRWLPRTKASDIALPGNDFWLFDDRVVRFGYFSGDGNYLYDEVSLKPEVVELCHSAFENVWSRAIDHSDYHPS